MDTTYLSALQYHSHYPKRTEHALIRPEPGTLLGSAHLRENKTLAARPRTLAALLPRGHFRKSALLACLDGAHLDGQLEARIELTSFNGKMQSLTAAPVFASPFFRERLLPLVLVSKLNM